MQRTGGPQRPQDDYSADRIVGLAEAIAGFMEGSRALDGGSRRELANRLRLLGELYKGQGCGTGPVLQAIAREIEATSGLRLVGKAQ